MDTAEAFVNASPSGYFVAELEDALHVSVQDTLLHLVEEQRIARQLVSGFVLVRLFRAGGTTAPSSYLTS